MLSRLTLLPPRILRAAALCLVAGLPVPPALAQSEQQQAYPIVIKGLQDARGADDLPHSSDTLDEEFLREQQLRSVREALQDLPNTSVRSAPARLAVSAKSSAFARDGNTGINIRGLGGNRVLMTVDGVRMPRSYVSRSAVFDREYLSLDLVKRVELIRGPASALYGSDGMAGVVNFVTYDPLDFLRSAPGEQPHTMGGRVAAAWDSDDDGLALGATIAGQAGDSVRWLLSATERRAHGLATRGNDRSANSNRTVANPQRDRSPGLLGKVVVEPDAAQRHVFTFEHNQKKSTVDLLSSRAPAPVKPDDVMHEDSRYQARRSRLSWTGRYNLESAWADQLSTVVAMQRTASRRVGTSDLLDGTHRVRDNSYRENTWQLGLRLDKTLYGPTMTHRISWGADHTRSRISNLYDGQAPLPPEHFPLKRFPDTRETTTALYVQDEASMGRWTFTPGLRLDHYAIRVTSQQGFFPPAARPGQSQSGGAVLPKLGVLYHLSDEWRVYGQYAGGFRPPGANQLNDRLEAFVGPQHVVLQPNPDLKPERSRGLEFGLRGRAGNLRLDVAAFYNRYSNLIMDAELVRSAGPLQEFQAVNIPRARIHGVELKGSWDWGRVADGQLTTSFSWGIARGRNLGTGRPINSVDPPQLALGARYEATAWTFYAEARHHASKRMSQIDSATIMSARDGTQFATPAATTLDVGLQWRPRPGVRVNLAVRNLTNRKYWLWPDVYGITGDAPALDAYSRPGRSAHLSVAMDF